jgi:hypothetical protein
MKLYVALLRGINVGGSTVIRMPTLKACFEAQGFRDVATAFRCKKIHSAEDWLLLCSPAGSGRAFAKRHFK